MMRPQTIRVENRTDTRRFWTMALMPPWTIRFEISRFTTVETRMKPGGSPGETRLKREKQNVGLVPTLHVRLPFTRARELD